LQVRGLPQFIQMKKGEEVKKCAVAMIMFDLKKISGENG
jgi:hypothetical protein